jgi:hypothetical protein
MFQRLQRHRILLLTTAIGTVTVLGLSACGGSSATAQKVATLGASDTSVTTTTTAQSSQEQVLKFVSCLRDQGLDVPDPKFDADGNLSGRLFERGGAIDPRSDTTRAAIDKCRTLVGDVRLGPGGGRRFDPQQMQTVFNDFTSCLRKEGIEVNDVTFGPPGDRPAGASGAGAVAGASGPQGGFGPPPGGDRPRDGQGFDPTKMLINRLGLDANDAKVKAAVAKCEPALTASLDKMRGNDNGGAGASGANGNIKSTGN